jgi:hypothetical protein
LIRWPKRQPRPEFRNGFSKKGSGEIGSMELFESNPYRSYLHLQHQPQNLQYQSYQQVNYNYALPRTQVGPSNVPSIRVVDSSIAYGRQYSTQLVLPPASESIWRQSDLFSTLPSAAENYSLPKEPSQRPFENVYTDFREAAADQPENVSPIKLHIHQIREEANEWRQKWMESQVDCLEGRNQTLLELRQSALLVCLAKDTTVFRPHLP